MADLYALGFSYYIATCNEPRNRSFCGHYHVTDGAYKIGILGLVLAFAQIGCGILFQGHRHWLGSVLLITGCISMLVFFCLIIAKQVRKPLLFLPFLIVEGIGLVVLWSFEVLLFVYLLFFHKVRLPNAETDADSVQSIFDRTNDYDAHSALDALAGLSTLAVCFILLGNVIVLFFTHWIYWIVWRAWRFIRREVAYKQQPITKTIPATISTNQSPTGGDPVTQHQQNPTSVAGGSIPSSFTDTVPHQLQVHTKGVEESVPSTLIDIDPVITQQQVPTNVAGGSIPTSFITDVPEAQQQQQQVPANAFDEQLPIPTASNPIIRQVPAPGGGWTICIWPPGPVPSDNAPATDQQQDSTDDGVEENPSNLEKFHNGD